MEHCGTSSRLVVKTYTVQTLAGTLAVMTDNFRGFPQSCHESYTKLPQLGHTHLLCILSDPLFNTKTLITNKCTKSFINCNTLLHVSTLLGHLQGELFVIVI
jgi:hypothetical protein